MKKKNNNRSKYALIVLTFVLVISIGYAALTTALKINSNISLGAASFDIHFDNVGQADHKATVISDAEITNEAKTEIAFEISLPRVSDYYIFTTDIVNEGSIPAKVKSIELNGLTESQKKLITYRVKYTVSNKTLAIGDYLGPYSTKNVTVEVIYELADDVTVEDLPASTLDLECEFVINFENGNLDEYRQRAAANRLMQDVDYFPTSFVNFNSSTNSDEHLGIYRLDGTENDDFPIYFYRGDNAHINNHLLFGGYCWRIIRTTDTGGIKIIYNGLPNEDGHCLNLTGVETTLTTHAYGWSWDYSASSIKTWLSTWYFENLIKNQAYLEDTPFCNRTYSNGDVSLDCDDEHVFSVANLKNNYPIGLLTAQEANLCGQTTSASTFGWLWNNTNYWTMSGSSSYGSNVYFIHTTGLIEGNVGGSNVLYIRPVVSLNSEVVISGGAGTTTNPYTVSLG